MELEEVCVRDVSQSSTQNTPTLIQDSSFECSSRLRASLAAVQRATAAIPSPILLSISISTSMPIPYAGTLVPVTLEKWEVWLRMKPMAPRVQSLGWEGRELSSKNGLSSLSSLLTTSGSGKDGSVFPSHSHNQHKRRKSSRSILVVRPEELREMWLSTDRIMPVSDEGDTAQVARA